MDLSRLVPVAAVLGACVIASLTVGLVAESPVSLPEAPERAGIEFDEAQVVPTPTALAIDASPVTLRELGLSEAAQLELRAARWPASSCEAGPIEANDWTERFDADLDGDGGADIVRLRAGPVINPGQGLIEMAVEFSDGRIHQGRLHDHRLGLQTIEATSSAVRQARPIRLDGSSRDVILFTNPAPQLDVPVGPTTWVIGIVRCRPVILADAGVRGEAWCPDGGDGEARIELAWSRSGARMLDDADALSSDAAVLLPRL